MADIRNRDFGSDKSFAALPTARHTITRNDWKQTRIRRMTFHINNIAVTFQMQWFLHTNISVSIETLELGVNHLYL